MMHEENARMEILEDRFRELLEAAPDAIVQVDAAGRIEVLNAAMEQMFGYSREELLGKPIEILIPEDLRALHAKHRELYRTSPHTRPLQSGLQLTGRRKDGTCFPAEISLSPVTTSGSFRVTAIIRDTTERKQAEDRLQEVQRRYLSELELRNREIERADRLKSEFLNSMSHELRTPLHTVIGFSELLLEETNGILDPRHRRFLDNIHRDSLHLLSLVNDILDLGKIEAGQLRLHEEDIDLTDLLGEALFTIRPQASAKSIEIETSIDAPQRVHADRLRLKQVLYNLLSNAVKFTPERGRIRIDVATRCGQAHISVSDTGIGIPASEHDAIFDKFYQVGVTTKGVREGTGLGLAITKLLVEQHGGHIWVESEPGCGSRFTFTIPSERPVATSGAGRHLPVAASISTPAPHSCD